MSVLKASIDNYPVFIVNDNEEFKKIQQKLFNIGIIWITDTERVFDEDNELCPLYIFIDKSRGKFFYRPNKDLMHDSVIATIIDNFEVEGEVSDKTYTLLEFDKVFKTTPNYLPKKKRILEKNNNPEYATEIMVLIRNLDELTLLYNNIKPLGFEMSEGFFNLFKHDDIAIDVFINLMIHTISQTTLDNHQRKKISDIHWLDGVWEKELTIEDLPYIVRIIRAGRVTEERPNYSPRKINKLDEAIEYENIPDYSPILDQEEQRKLFKVGDKVIIRPDAYDYFSDIDGQYMNRDLGKEVVITQINTLDDVYIMDIDKGEYGSIKNTSVVNKDDLLITVKSPRHFHTYYWYYRCLFTPSYKPSYSPKKKVMLEKLNEEYRGELTDSINHSHYFSKYNAFFVVFDNDISRKDYDNVREILMKIFNVEVAEFGYLYTDEVQFYIVIRINRTSEEVESGWNGIGALKDSNERNEDIYPRTFTINEVNSETKVNHILRNGGVIPSYSPRKINKFDES